MALVLSHFSGDLGHRTGPGRSPELPSQGKRGCHPSTGRSAAGGMSAYGVLKNPMDTNTTQETQFVFRRLEEAFRLFGREVDPYLFWTLLLVLVVGAGF